MVLVTKRLYFIAFSREPSFFLRVCRETSGKKLTTFKLTLLVSIPVAEAMGCCCSWHLWLSLVPEGKGQGTGSDKEREEQLPGLKRSASVVSPLMYPILSFG